eukprot:7296469-Prorocentrum_lima.AAC.1
MAAWLQHRCDWELDHPSRHPQWMLAFTLWGLEQLGIAQMTQGDPEAALSVLRESGLTARVQRRYLPCTGWAQGVRSG